ncbi:MAG: hypothetical protein K2I72_00150 [Bacilli bacterium]|nr:hypothetical protein [Bacilli bacterium]
MVWKEASFIYLDGQNYHEKRFAYEEWSDEVEIRAIRNIQYSAENISGSLLRSMKREIGNRFRLVFKNQPFHIERSIYEKSNETRQIVIIGENQIVVKKGSFCDEKIFGPFQRYYKYNQKRLSEHDLVKRELYYPLLELFQAMMDGKVDQVFFKEACSTVPSDVYLELLQVFRGMAGFDPTWMNFEEGKEKVKRLLEYYQ